MRPKIYGIFTKPIHVEKIVNYLNFEHPLLVYHISTEKPELSAFGYDLGVSYCFPHIVKVSKAGVPWYNYHPAPLPEYPGLFNYSKAIRERVTEFGVTLHRMTDEVDQGDILKIKRFRLESSPVNTNELGNITHYYLFQLFKETIAKLGELEPWECGPLG